MTATITLANLIAYGAQAAVVAVAGGALLAVFRTQPAQARYLCWRALLLLCLVLPWLQTPQEVPLPLTASAPAFTANIEPAAAAAAPARRAA